MCAADLIVGISFGAVVIATGLPGWFAVVSSLTIFGGGAQFLLAALLAGGGGAVAAIIGALVVNARLAPLALSVAPVLGPGWVRRVFGAHVVTDETVAFALAQRSGPTRSAALWLSGTMLFIAWNIGVIIGVLAGGLVSDVGALGLDATFPAVLLALVVPTVRTSGLAPAVSLGVAGALLATPYLPSGVPVLLALGAFPLALKRRENREAE